MSRLKFLAIQELFLREKEKRLRQVERKLATGWGQKRRLAEGVGRSKVAFRRGFGKSFKTAAIKVISGNRRRSNNDSFVATAQEDEAGDQAQDSAFHEHE